MGLGKYKLYVHLIRVPQLLGVDWVSLSTQYLLGADTRRAPGCDPRDTEKCKGVYRDSWTGVYTHHVFYNSKNKWLKCLTTAACLNDFWPYPYHGKSCL